MCYTGLLLPVVQPARLTPELNSLRLRKRTPGHVLEFDKAHPVPLSAGRNGNRIRYVPRRRREFGFGSPAGCRAVPRLLSAPPTRTRCQRGGLGGTRPGWQTDRDEIRPLQEYRLSGQGSSFLPGAERTATRELASRLSGLSPSGLRR